MKRLKEEIEIIASGGAGGGSMGKGAAEELNEPAPMINPSYPNLPMGSYLNDKLFCKINTAYPGLQLVHEKPYIFIINNFLNQVDYITWHHRPCTMHHPPSNPPKQTHARRGTHARHAANTRGRTFLTLLLSST